MCHKEDNLVLWFFFRVYLFFHDLFTVLGPSRNRASLVAQLGKNLPAMREAWVQSLAWEDPLEKGKATYSSILAWRIAFSPWGHKELDTTEWLLLHRDRVLEDWWWEGIGAKYLTSQLWSSSASPEPDESQGQLWVSLVLWGDVWRGPVTPSKDESHVGFWG